MRMKYQDYFEVGKTYELDYNGIHAVGVAVSDDDFVVQPGSECNPVESERSDGTMMALDIVRSYGVLGTMALDIVRSYGVLGTMENGKYGFIKPYHETHPYSVAFAIVGTSKEELPAEIWKEVKP